MIKFAIIDVTGNSRDISYLIKELRQKNLIAGTEKDVHGETIYHTNSIASVKKLMEDYDNLMLDIVKAN
ncbi:MAG: hypothetical protein Q8920_09350 [Bacillota bacterium]|nr:hypothetical protein [Bacillota bacterium]